MWKRSEWIETIHCDYVTRHELDEPQLELELV